MANLIITFDCIKDIINEVSKPKNPVLQIVRLSFNDFKKEYNVGLSDRCNLIRGIISNDLVKTVCKEKQLERGMIIKLTNYSLNNSITSLSNTTSLRNLIILGFELVGNDINRSQVGLSRLQQPPHLRPPIPAVYGLNNSYSNQ